MANGSSEHTPLAKRNKAHGEKKSLIEKVKALATADLFVERFGKRGGFEGISNSKLLRLHKVLETVKTRFGSRDKLIDAVVTAHGRTKDADYKKHFAEWSLPRLLDSLSSAGRRNLRAEAKGDKKPEAAKAPKAEAKKPAAKPEAAKAPKAEAKKPEAPKAEAAKPKAEEKPKAEKKPAAKKPAK